MKNVLTWATIGALGAAVMAAVLAGPALTLYGLFGLITGGGVGASLIAGPIIWAGVSMGHKKLASAPAMQAMDIELELDKEAKALRPKKKLAPDFNPEAAVTLEKKIAIRPALKLKSKRHDLG